MALSPAPPVPKPVLRALPWPAVSPSRPVPVGRILESNLQGSDILPRLSRFPSIQPPSEIPPTAIAPHASQPKVIVGIADLAATNKPGPVLSTYSLGSCIGVSAYDPQSRVGGLVHMMLPDSSIEPRKAASQPAMFIDTGIPALLGAVEALGANRQHLVICAAGGAQVLDSGGFFNIGRRNYENLMSILKHHDLRLHAEQIGGLVSRSMFLHTESGGVRLKISGQMNDMILCKSLTNT